MKDRSDDPSHHERTLLPRSYISLIYPLTPVVEHWLERKIAQWVHLMKDRSDDPSHHERTLLPRSYISLLYPLTPVVEHWLERKIAQWVHLMKDRSDDPSHHERTLLPRSYISLLYPLSPCRNTVFSQNYSWFHSMINWSRLKVVPLGCSS